MRADTLPTLYREDEAPLAHLPESGRIQVRLDQAQFQTTLRSFSGMCYAFRAVV